MSKHKIVYLPIDSIKPYEKNPRKNENAVQYVANSIQNFGFKNPIIIDENKVIVCGHTRRLAAKQLGMEEVLCIVADDLNEEQIRAFRVADNKTGEMAEWDIELLNTELLDLEANFDMADFGFEINAPNENKERNEANYDENISVLVKCEDEAQAQSLFDRLTAEGYSCQVSTL